MNTEELTQLVRKKFERARTDRTAHESEIKRAYDLVLPIRQWDQVAGQVVDRARVYDSIGKDKLNKLKSNIQRFLFSQNSQWCEINFLNQKLAKMFSSQTSALKDTNSELFRFLSDSNFYIETSRSLADLIVAGNMCVKIIDKTGEPLAYQSIPIDQIWFTVDYRDRVDCVFRVHHMTAADCEEEFGENCPADILNQKHDNAKRFKITECIVKQKSDWVYACYKDGWQIIGQPAFMKHNPYVVAQWELVQKTCWGNSPMRDALPELSMMMEMTKDIIKAAESMAFPNYWGDGNVVNDDLPGSSLAGGKFYQVDPGATINELKWGGDLTVAINMKDKIAEQISKLTYDLSLPADQQLQYMSPVGITARQTEAYTQFGEPIMLFSNRYLQPIAEQSVLRLYDRGELEVLDDDTIKALADNQGMEIESQWDILRVDVSAAVQKALDMQAASDTANAVARTAQIVGPTLISRHVDIDELTRRLLLGFGAEADLLLDPDEAAKIGDQQVQQNNMANIIQLMGGQGGASAQQAQDPNAIAPDPNSGQ